MIGFKGLDGPPKTDLLLGYDPNDHDNPRVVVVTPPAWVAKANFAAKAAIIAFLTIVVVGEAIRRTWIAKGPAIAEWAHDVWNAW